jgi:hypothetical protein
MQTANQPRGREENPRGSFPRPSWLGGAAHRRAGHADEAACSRVDEPAAVIEVGTVFEGNVPKVAFGVAEAETAAPPGLVGPFVQVGDIVELANQPMRPENRLGVWSEITPGTGRTRRTLKHS